MRRREEYRIWARLEPDGPEWKSIQSQHSSASPATPSAASSRSPRSSSTLFFVFSFPFLLPPLFLLFIISRWFVVSLVAALLLAPSSTGMQDYARARWISPRFVDRVTWTAFKFFEGLDWGGIFIDFIAGLFPCSWEERELFFLEGTDLFVRSR